MCWNRPADAHGQRQQVVFAQAVVVIDVFAAEREAKQALGEEALQGMLVSTGIAVISEAGCQTPGQADAPVDGPQQQGPAIEGHPAAVKAARTLRRP